MWALSDPAFFSTYLKCNEATNVCEPCGTETNACRDPAAINGINTDALNSMGGMAFNFMPMNPTTGCATRARTDTRWRNARTVAGPHSTRVSKYGTKGRPRTT